MPIHTHTPHPTCCGKLSCRVTDGRLQMELVPEKKVFATELRVSLWWSLKCKSGWYKTTGFRPQEQYVCIIAGRSPLKHLRSTGFFSTPRTRTHQGSSDEQITRESRIKLSYCLFTLSPCGPALHHHRAVTCNSAHFHGGSLWSALGLFFFFTRFSWHVLVSTGVWGEPQLKEKANKAKAAQWALREKNSTRLPFAIMCGEDKEDKGAQRRALSSLSKALFFKW